MSVKDTESALHTVKSVHENLSVKYALPTDLGGKVGANEASLIQISKSSAKPDITASFQSLNSGTPNKLIKVQNYKFNDES